MAVGRAQQQQQLVAADAPGLDWDSLSSRTAITHFPKLGILVKGARQSFRKGQPLIASVHAASPLESAPGKGRTVTMEMYDRRMNDLAFELMANRRHILNGSLDAADFIADKSNLDHLILVKLYNQVLGKQMPWFFLDEMFVSMPMDQLTLRMTYKDNPAAAQRVPRRARYDQSYVAYDEIEFNLEKTVMSYDIPIEDPMRALLSPTEPIEQSQEYSIKFARENDAMEALKKLKYYYKRSDLSKGADAFEHESAPTLASDDDNIPNPEPLDANGFHSKNKTVNELQKARTAFLKLYDLPLTHAACSPTTAMNIAQNTWTGANTIFNVEAYRTVGGVRPFPGLADATMVIAPLLDDNVIYWTSKPSLPLVLGEGPKITKKWDDEEQWTNKSASADFYQYKCAHEDLSEIPRKFGVIMQVSTEGTV